MGYGWLGHARVHWAWVLPPSSFACWLARWLASRQAGRLAAGCPPASLPPTGAASSKPACLPGLLAALLAGGRLAAGCPLASLPLCLCLLARACLLAVLPCLLACLFACSCLLAGGKLAAGCPLASLPLCFPASLGLRACLLVCACLHVRLLACLLSGSPPLVACLLAGFLPQNL